MAIGRAIANRFRHRRRLGPDDVNPQNPAIVLKRERGTPGDAREVATPGTFSYECIPKVQPECSIIPQHAVNLAADLQGMTNVKVGGWFVTQLATPCTAVACLTTGDRDGAGIDLGRVDNASAILSVGVPIVGKFRRSREGFGPFMLTS